MKKLQIQILLFFLVFTTFANLSIFGKTLNKKILVLIIASDDLPVYIEEQKIWREYMHLDPNIEAYFLKANSELSQDCKIEDDIIWSKTEENIYPGILNKTIFSLEYFLPRIKEFRYVIRTNLSSFYVFPRLLKFLTSLPKNKCYCGMYCVAGCPWASGSGFIISMDLANLLVKKKEMLLEVMDYDDVVIGRFFQNRGIGLIPAKRADIQTLSDWFLHKDDIPDDIFHFRLKNFIQDLRITDEVYIQKQLLKKFYNIELD